MADDLQVILKAKELAVHTLRITSNANRYPKKFRFSLVDKMQNKSMDDFIAIYNRSKHWFGCRSDKGLLPMYGINGKTTAKRNGIAEDDWR